MTTPKQQKPRRREARLAAEGRAQAGAKRRRRGLVLSLAGAGAALVALVAVLVVVNASGGSAPKVTAADPVLGNPNAPVTIVEYGDFKCPFCTAWAIQTEPKLKHAFIDTGKVRLVWHDFVHIDPESEPAAEAARCAGAQGRFWQYHDALYHFTWDNFYAGGGTAEGRSAFAGLYDQLARVAGVEDTAAFSACRAAGTYRNAVARSSDAAAGQGVDGTPTFFIGGQKIVGAQPYDVFRRLIDAQLGGS